MSKNKLIEKIVKGKPIIVKDNGASVLVKYTEKMGEFGSVAQHIVIKKDTKVYDQVFNPQKQNKIVKKAKILINFIITFLNLKNNKIESHKHLYTTTTTTDMTMKDIINESKKTLKKLFSISEKKITEVELVSLYVNGSKQNTADIGKIKMYKVNFKYHDLGLNNEGSQDGDCVPSTLLRLYNNPQEKNNRRRLKRLTMQRIVEQLSSYYKTSSNLDNEYDEPTQYSGFDSYQVQHFCNRNRIRCYVLDHKCNIYMTNIKTGIKFNDGLPALVYMVASSHLYLLDDTKLRESVFKRNNRNAKNTDKQDKTDEKDDCTDVLIDETDVNYDVKQKLYITERGKVNEMFYDDIRSGNIYGSHVKVSDEGVIQYKKNKTSIFYNPQVKQVIDMITKLNQEDEKQPYKFTNQQLHGLAAEYYQRNYGHVQSVLSPEMDTIFNDKLAKNFSFTEFWKKPKTTKNLHAYDMNKHYTSCLQSNDMGWSVFSATDNVEEFNGCIQTGFYYVETKNYFPLRGNGIYADELIKLCLDENIITKDDIKLQFIPSQTLDKNHFQNFVDDVFSKFGDNAKFAMNGFIGLLRRDYRTENKHFFTSDREVVDNEFLVNNDLNTIKPVFEDKELPEVDEDDDRLELDVDDFFKQQDESKVMCYHIDATKKFKILSNDLPIHMKIYDLSAVKCYKLAKEVNGKLFGVHTDSLYFIGGVKPKLSNEIGGYREVPIPDMTLIKCNKGKPRTDFLNVDLEPWTDVNPDEVENFKQSIMINGRAGTGKSTLIEKLKSNLDEQGIAYKVAAPTHKAAINVKGQTIHRLFMISTKTNRFCKKTLDVMKEDGIKYIFLDEISMINKTMWGILAYIKKMYNFIFIGCGDFAQLKPVLEDDSEYQNSQVLKYIFDGNRCLLTKIHRTNDEKLLNVLTSILDGNKINENEFGNKETNLNLCWSNACVDTINKRKNNNYAKCYDHIQLKNMKVYQYMPVIAKTTTKDFCNNENFTVNGYDDDYIYVYNDYRGEINITYKEFETSMKLAYAITVHKSQGMTIDRPYSIWEYEHMRPEMAYVALSRATHSKLINLRKANTILFHGYIYKYTNKRTGKMYIGSTRNYKKRCIEHEESMENDKFHVALRKTPQDFVFEVIHTGKYADDEQLKQEEQKYINKFNTIKYGYNTLNSSDEQKY